MIEELSDDQLEIAEAIMEGSGQTVEEVISCEAGRALIGWSWDNTVEGFYKDAEDNEETWEGEAECPFEKEEKPMASFDEGYGDMARSLSVYEDGSVLEDLPFGRFRVWPSVEEFLKAEYGDLSQYEILREDPDSAAGQLTAFNLEGW